MKINQKKELEETESNLMSLNENERMTRFKTGDLKELHIELKELESEIKF